MWRPSGQLTRHRYSFCHPLRGVPFGGATLPGVLSSASSRICLGLAPPATFYDTFGVASHDSQDRCPTLSPKKRLASDAQIEPYCAPRERRRRRRSAAPRAWEAAYFAGEELGNSPSRPGHTTPSASPWAAGCRPASRLEGGTPALR